MSSTATVKNEAELKTCKVTIVNPGSSDSVIKVFPAAHESEKVWLDNNRGKERWEYLQRVMAVHAKRGETNLKPVFYHSSVQDLRTIEITDADIPVVHLEDYVLEAPKAEQITAVLPEQVNLAEDNLKLRMERLETQNAQLLAALQGLQAKPAPVNEVSSDVACGNCARVFKNAHGLQIHSGSCKK